MRPGPFSIAFAIFFAFASAPADDDPRAETTDPVKDLPLFMQVRAYRRDGAFDRAHGAAQRLLDEMEADPDAKDYELRNRAEQVRILEHILTLSPAERTEVADADRLIHEYGRAMQDARFAEAEAFARRQLSVRRRLLGADHHDVATSLHVLGLARAALGDYGEAGSLFRKSKQIYLDRLGPKAASVAMSCDALGNLYLKTGDYRRAAEEYRESVRLYRNFHYENERHLGEAMKGLADVLQKQGKLQEAEVVYGEAISVLRHQAGSSSVASVATNLARILEAQGDLARAEPLYREALRAQRAEHEEAHPLVADALAALADLIARTGGSEEAARLRTQALTIREEVLGPSHLEVGRSLAALAASRLNAEDLAAADSLYRGALDVFTVAQPDHPDVALAEHGLGDVALGRGELEEAARRYRRALAIEESAFGEHHTAILATRIALAEVAWARGDSAAAIAHLERATDAYEGARRRVGSLEARATFHESPDARLAAAYLTCGREEDAWLPAERSHGRVLADLLLAGGESGAPVAPAGRIRETLDEVTAIAGWLEVAIVPESPSAWAWVLRRDGAVRWLRLPALLGDARGGTIADTLREELTVAGAWPFRVPENARTTRVARRLAAARIDPLLEALDGIERLILVPSGSLLGIPVEMLPDDEGRALGSRFAISYVPSATVHAWLAEQERPATTRTSALVVGDPVVASHVDLPSSGREVRAVAAGFDAPRVLTGPEATESALHRLAQEGDFARFGTIHFATHAFVDPVRPERSALVLSTDGNRNRLVAALRGERIDDGRLTIQEFVGSWRLAADLVTLSGCGTALGRRVDSEGYLGFAHALLRVGARSLVLSLWKVDDDATSRLMGRFYENLTAGMTKAEALKAAREWLRDWRSPEGERTFAHPAYWAAFVLVGDAS